MGCCYVSCHFFRFAVPNMCDLPCFYNNSCVKELSCFLLCFCNCLPQLIWMFILDCAANQKFLHWMLHFVQFTTNPKDLLCILECFCIKSEARSSCFAIELLVWNSFLGDILCVASQPRIGECIMMGSTIWSFNSSAFYLASLLNLFCPATFLWTGEDPTNVNHLLREIRLSPFTHHDN